MVWSERGRELAQVSRAVGTGSSLRSPRGRPPLARSSPTPLLRQPTASSASFAERRLRSPCSLRMELPDSRRRSCSSRPELGSDGGCACAGRRGGEEQGGSVAGRGTALARAHPRRSHVPCRPPRARVRARRLSTLQRSRHQCARWLALAFPRPSTHTLTPTRTRAWAPMVAGQDLALVWRGRVLTRQLPSLGGRRWPRKAASRAGPCPCRACELHSSWRRLLVIEEDSETKPCSDRWLGRRRAERSVRNLVLSPALALLQPWHCFGPDRTRRYGCFGCTSF